MKLPARATARHFQQEVAKLLTLPSGSCDVEVRKALLAKGPDFLTWYDTRLQAIAESRAEGAQSLSGKCSSSN
jgi:hypothetical protein